MVTLIEPDVILESEIDGLQVLRNIERIGRTCYKSEDKITEDSATKFVQMILKRGHESVLEHVSITVRIICDRGVTHEIVRHRIASYSQESTRYCNYGKVGEIKVIDIRPNLKYTRSYEVWMQAMKDCEAAYMKLLELGETPQIARSVLPNSLKTEIVCTFNIREWRHFFKLRTSPAAHPQMREIICPLLLEFQELIPVVFDDIGW